MPDPSDQAAFEPHESEHQTAPLGQSAEPDLATLVRQIERSVAEIRRDVDSTVRENRYREFSSLRLTAAILQTVVIGLSLLAITDYLTNSQAAVPVLAKLGLATVCQLAALTAVVASKR